MAFIACCDVPDINPANKTIFKPFLFDHSEDLSQRRMSHSSPVPAEPEGSGVKGQSLQSLRGQGSKVSPCRAWGWEVKGQPLRNLDPEVIGVFPEDSRPRGLRGQRSIPDESCLRGSRGRMKISLSLSFSCYFVQAYYFISFYYLSVFYSFLVLLLILWCCIS